MNNRRGYYFPVVAFTLLLLLVWLLSWVAVVAELFLGTDIGIDSLVSAEGVRWALRSALPSLNDAPWGTIMLVLFSFGLFRGSGLLRFARHLFSPQRLTRNERRAALFTLLAFFFYSALLYVATMAPWQLLLGVSGAISGSPFMQGVMLLLFLGVLLLSSVYGFIYGNYRSVADVVSGVGDTIALFVPALIAVVPATGIIPCMEYTGVFDWLGTEPADVNVIYDIIISLPFLHTILLHLIEKRN